MRAASGGNIPSRLSFRLATLKVWKPAWQLHVLYAQIYQVQPQHGPLSIMISAMPSHDLQILPSCSMSNGWHYCSLRRRAFSYHLKNAALFPSKLRCLIVKQLLQR